MLIYIQKYRPCVYELSNSGQTACFLLLSFFDNICLLYKNGEIDKEMVEEKYRPMMLQIRKMVDDAAMAVLKDQLQENDPFEDFVAQVHVWREEISKKTSEKLLNRSRDGKTVDKKE